MSRWRPLPRQIPALLGLVLAGAVQAVPGSIEFYQGKLAFEAGRWVEAGKAFAAAGRAGYPPDQVHFWMARTYQATSSRERARKHFLKAREAGMRSDELTLELAKLWKDVGDYAAALRELQDLPVAFEARSEYQLLLGEILTMKGDFDPAYEALKRAIHDHPYQVHSISGYLPELQLLALQDLAQKRMAAVEAEEEARKTKAAQAAAGQAPSLPTPTATLPAQPSSPDGKPYLSPIGYFGSQHAFQEKTAIGTSFRLDRFGDGSEKPAGNSGPLTLNAPTYRGSTMK